MIEIAFKMTFLRQNLIKLCLNFYENYFVFAIGIALTFVGQFRASRTFRYKCYRKPKRRWKQNKI